MNTSQPLLSISNLTFTRNSMAVVTDGHLAVNKGECICLVGPNGSGKTSLAELLAGTSPCLVQAGLVTFLKNESLCKKNNVVASEHSEQLVSHTESNLLSLTPACRARYGLYVAFQHVPEFDGVTAETFLYEAYAACHGVRPVRSAFRNKLIEYCDVVGLQIAHLERSLFKGFSGGERKRFQLLELLVLCPQLAVLDELDAGLDAEGLQLFFSIIKRLRTKISMHEHGTSLHEDVSHEDASHEDASHEDAWHEESLCSFLIITHNQAVINALSPDRLYELSDHTLRELPATRVEEKVL